MSQPVWKYLANLGDANPLKHGGYFVYKDETGVYPEEGEMLEVLDETDDPHYLAYRFALEPCTYVNGILSDNKFHPDHPAWFAHPESGRKDRPQDTTHLKNVADHEGMTEAELVALFCSMDPLARAVAYRAVGDYHGFENLDSYPLPLRKREARKRYQKELGL